MQEVTMDTGVPFRSVTGCGYTQVSTHTFLSYSPSSNEVQPIDQNDTFLTKHIGSLFSFL